MNIMSATKVDVDTKTFVRFVLVVSAFIGAVFLVMQIWPALLLIAISFFLALALNPSVSAMSQRLPGKSRVFATLIAYVIMLSIIGGFVYIAVPPTIDQTMRFIDGLPAYISDLSEHRGAVAGFVNDIITRYQLQDELSTVVSSIQTQALNAAGGIGGSVVTGVSSFFVGLVSVVTVLVLTFLMLIEGPRWQERIFSLVPGAAKRTRYHGLAAKMFRIVSSYVNGQVIVALIAAMAGLLTLFILTQVFNLPLSIVLPLTGLIFLTDLVPLIGATIGAIVIVLVLLFNDIGAAVAFLVYFIIYQQIENNFIQPIVQSRTVALSALSILVAVIIGVSLLGIVGGILAIPIAGCIRVAVLDYMEHRHNNGDKKPPAVKLATKKA